MIENTANEDDRVTLRLYSERGIYAKTFDVSAGEPLKINVRDLQQNAMPDDKGNLLFDTLGVLSLVGSHSNRSKLSYGKIFNLQNKRSPAFLRGFEVLLVLERANLNYIPGYPPCSPPPAGAFLSSGTSETRASVVSIRAAMDAAFCRAVRVTLVGSITPALTRSSNLSV